MNLDYHLIENCRTDRFPFKMGEKILIRWGRGWPDDTATITELHTSSQWGHEVVHAVMVLIEGRTTPRAVSPCLFEKIDATPQTARNGKPVQQTFDFY